MVLSTHRLLALPVLALVLASCNVTSRGTKGSGNLKTETRDVRGFSSITLSGIGELTFAQSGTESLTIEAEDNLLPLLTSTVADDRLALGIKGSVQPTKPIHYTVTLKNFAGVEVSGTGNVTGRQIHANAIKVGIGGAGNVTLAGHATDAVVTLSGTGNYDAAELACDAVSVSMSGMGAGVVQAKDSLDVKISGMGKLEYTGDPKVTQSVTGLGTVRKR